MATSDTVVKPQRAAAVLLQITLATGILVGCGVASRPADGHLDLPHFASQAASKEMEPSGPWSTF